MTGNLLKYFKIALLSTGFYFIFVALFSRSLADNDLWGYLSFGKVFWEEGYFPYRDVFSYTPTKPLWIYHEWLTGLFFYFIYKYSGTAGLQLLRYIIIILTIYFIYLTAIKRGGKPISALIALLPAVVLISFGYVPVRAQIFTYLFFVLTVYILEIARQDKKWHVIWWLVPIQILWCNFHGGFLAGIGMIFLYAFGEGLSGRKFVPFIKIGIISSIATMINPYGFEYWEFMRHAVSMARPEITEWMSVIAAIKMHVQVVPVLIFICLSIFCIIFFGFRRKHNITDILVVFVVLYLGCKHIRHGVFFGLVFGAYVPVILSEFWKDWKETPIFFTSRQWLPQVFLLALFLTTYGFINPSLSLTLVPNFNVSVSSPNYPTGALKWMEENNFRGNVLPDFDWGEFLMWTCYPYCKVAMDGRYETVYKREVYQEYFDFLMGRENWRAFLIKYPHDMVLIKPNTKTHFLMLREPSWQLAYSDSGCVLFLKKILTEG
jgi:hypothetical protein